MMDEYMGIVNLMGERDIYQLPYDKITKVCRKYSRGRTKSAKGQRDAFSKVIKLDF